MPALAIHDHPLPYVSLLETRPGSAIDLVVIHCTELPDLASARRYGEQVRYASGTGNSGHYYIDYDGSVHRYVADDRIAHHTRGYNPRSIGIELSNRGRWPDWLDSRRQQMDEPYTAAQIEALLQLLGRAQAHREGVGPTAQRDAPLRHRARRIGHEGRLERRDGGAELERVQQRHGAIERRLRRRRRNRPSESSKAPLAGAYPEINEKSATQDVRSLTWPKSFSRFARSAGTSSRICSHWSR